MYFDDTDIEEDSASPRHRTSSWSCSGGVAVVELRKKKRTQGKSATAITKSKKSVLNELKGEISRSKSDSNLNQQKIDKIFTKHPSTVPQLNSSCRSSDEEVQFKQHYNNRSTLATTAAEQTLPNINKGLQPSQLDPTNSNAQLKLDSHICVEYSELQLNISKGEVKTTSKDTERRLSVISNSTNKDNYLCSYGSDCESLIDQPETSQPSGLALKSLSDVPTSHTTKETTLENTKKTPDATNNMAVLTEESLQRLLTKFKEEIKEDNKISIQAAIDNGVQSIRDDLDSLRSFKTSTETEVKDIKTDVTKLQNDLEALKTELSTTRTNLELCKIELRETAGTNIRQEQKLDECCDKIEEISDRLDSNLLRIRGIIESKGESCLKKVNDFFVKTLCITQPIKIRRAHRIGKGSNRNILVHLKNMADKNVIFANASKLKDIKNDNNKSYSISNQMSARKHAQRMRNRQIQQTNEKSTGEKLDITAERGSLKIEGTTYTKLVKAPPLRDILWPSTARRKELLQVKPTRGEVVRIENQTFIGYTAVVKSIDEVNNHYAKIRSLHTEARHIVCGFRLPHRSFHMHQDFLDDDEHNGGSYLLQLLIDSGIMNRAIFVVRNYDGTHLGSKRYEAMKSAVQSALASAEKNSVTGNFDLIWEKDTRDEQRGSNTPIRGGLHQYTQRRTEKNLNLPQHNDWDIPLQSRLKITHKQQQQPQYRCERRN